MSSKSLHSVTLLLVGCLAVACQESSPTTPAEADLGLQSALTADGDAAIRSGDPERAEALRHAATALRNGGPDGARGQWKDLVNHRLWVATAGSAALELAATGNACPIQPADVRLRCILATFAIRITGSFQLVGSGGPDGSPIEIHTNADGVHGVVIKPAD